MKLILDTNVFVSGVFFSGPPFDILDAWRRKLGMTVLFAPTDVASQYVGTVPRERALAAPYLPVPNKRTLACRFTCRVGPCMCGPGIRCLVNYGWDGMHPGLTVRDSDTIVSGLPEMYSLCRKAGLTHLIYTGLHTNMCLFGKPPALRTRGRRYARGLGMRAPANLRYELKAQREGTTV